jgi:hypothetical protein
MARSATLTRFICIIQSVEHGAVGQGVTLQAAGASMNRPLVCAGRQEIDNNPSPFSVAQDNKKHRMCRGKR